MNSNLLGKAREKRTVGGKWKQQGRGELLALTWASVSSFLKWNQFLQVVVTIQVRWWAWKYLANSMRDDKTIWRSCQALFFLSGPEPCSWTSKGWVDHLGLWRLLLAVTHLDLLRCWWARCELEDREEWPGLALPTCWFLASPHLASPRGDPEVAHRSLRELFLLGPGLSGKAGELSPWLPTFSPITCSHKGLSE